MLGSSIGQDTALSRREEGFDSPTEYHIDLGVCERKPRKQYPNYQGSGRPRAAVVVIGLDRWRADKHASGDQARRLENGFS